VKDPLITVSLVLLTDNLLLNVLVHSNLVSMKFKEKLIAHLVTTDVTPVLLIPLVKNVLTNLTETSPQFVTVLMDTLKKMSKFAHLVPSNVKLVLIPKITVIPVLLSELNHQFVTVQWELSPSYTLMKMMLPVTNVLTNVSLVSSTKITV
jgi:hypothetical protein